MVHYAEVAHLAAEESGGAENPADQSTWQNIAPPVMEGPPPTEKDFIAKEPTYADFPPAYKPQPKPPLG